MSDKFYPPVTDLISTDQLPEQANFLNGAISNTLDSLLQKIYYRNLKAFASGQRGSGSFTIELILLEQLKLELPGVGIVLSLNHDVSSGSTVIPVSLSWHLPILKYAKSFHLQKFSFQPDAFFNIVSNIKPLSDQQLVLQASYAFINDPNPLETFANRLRIDEGAPIPSPLDSDIYKALDEIVTGIEGVLLDTSQYIWDEYVAGNYGTGDTLESFQLLFGINFNGDAKGFIASLFTPDASARIGLYPAITFPRQVLKPLDNNGNEVTTQDFTAVFDTSSGPIELYFSVRGGFGFDTDYSLSAHPNTPKAEIGNTGFTIGFQNAKLDLSRNRNIPEADSAGYSPDFIGVYITEATIGLPPFIKDDPGNPATVEIVGRNLLIGTGGITGTIGIETPGQDLCKKLGEFAICFDSFSITFQQNAVLGADIHGKLFIPGFKDGAGNDAQIDIYGAFSRNGDFSFTFSEQQGIPIRIPNVLEIVIKSLTIGEKNGKYYLRVTGELLITARPAGVDLTGGVGIAATLIIWEDGKLEIEGGRLILPKAITINAGPVTLSVTAIEKGASQFMYEGAMRQYQYFGFSGSLGVDPGGVDVHGNGVKYYYTHDELPFDHFLRVEGIGIDLYMPPGKDRKDAKVIIKGYLSMANPVDNQNATGNPAREYLGSVAFWIKTGKGTIGGGASMRLNPDIPAFLIDAFLELPKPIPLGSTGLGIYGFRGLFGQRYIPSKNAVGLSEEDSWWEYYKYDPEGVSFTKWEQRKGFSIGAGAAISGTESPTPSAKLMFLLGLPDVLLIIGQLNIISKKRLTLDDTEDPQVSVVLVISRQSIEIGASVQVLVPDEGNKAGNTFTLGATIEMAWFFQDAGAWYINIGRDTPEEKRIYARVLSIVNGYAYLMLSSSGIKAGAGASVEKSKKFGPVKLALGGYFDVAGHIAFRPTQLGGAVEIGAYIKVTVFGFGLGLTAGAGLAAEAAKPFVITGYLFVGLDLPKPLKDKTVKIGFTWIFDKTVDTSPIEPLKLPAASEQVPANAVNVMSGETFRINYVANSGTSAIPAPDAGWSYAFDDCVVPMDSFIDIEFNKGVSPEASVTNIGGHVSAASYTEKIPPERGYHDQVRHEYKIVAVRIKSWNGSQWVDYKAYDAVTAIKSLPNVSQNMIDGLKDGYWQMTEPGSYKKLRLLANNIFSYTSQNAPGSLTIENFGFGGKSIFCRQDEKVKTCINWSDINLNTLYNSGEIIDYRSLKMLFEDEGGEVLSVSAHGLSRGLHFIKKSNLEIYFPEPVSEIDIKLTGTSQNAWIHYYQFKEGTNLDDQGMNLPEFVEVQTDQYNTAGYQNTINYDNLNQPVDKILIEHNGGGDPLIANTAPLRIGTRTKDAPLTAWFKGRISDVMLSAEILDEAQVQDAMAGNLAPGLVAWYKLQNVPSNSVVTDSIGGYHGTFHGSPQGGSSGRLSVQFDGTDDYAEIPHDPAISFDNVGFTMMAWINTQEIDRGINTILDKRTTTGYHLYTYRGYIGYQLVVNDYYVNKLSAVKVADGQWHHVAVAYDAVNGIATIFVDGIEQESFQEHLYTPPGDIYLMELCYLTHEKSLFNISIPAQSQIAEEATKMVDGMTKAYQPVWRPNTKFAVQLEMQDIVHENEDDDNGTLQSYYYNFGFRTAGPVGHFHKELSDYLPLINEGREDEIMLSSLKHYIDYRHSYPDPGGKVINTKPLYWQSPKLLLFFAHPYVNAMFHTWDAYNGQPAISSALEGSIIDPLNNAAGEEIILQPAFQIKDFSFDREDEKIISNLAEYGENCVGVSGPIESFSMAGVYDMPVLEPDKLYTAVFKSVLNGEPAPVHNYGFRTSLYANLEAHINSYILSATPGSEIYAIFKQVYSPHDLSKAMEIVQGVLDPQDDLVKNFADKLDRLLNGALRLEALEACLSTEFNLLVDEQTGNLNGILIRSPEPFMDPRMELAFPVIPIEVENILDATGQPDPQQYSVIYSKDRASIFITTDNLQIAEGTVTITFRHYEYDGLKYHEIENAQAAFQIAAYL